MLQTEDFSSQVASVVGSAEPVVSAAGSDRDLALRPRSMQDYVGQRVLREQLKVFIQAALLLLCGQAAGAAVSQKSQPNEPCVAGAAAYHRVNAHVLAAILRVEGMGDTQVTSNSNGSVDVGRGGINSVHFPELAKWGVLPRDLLDSCKNVYVAGWLVQKNLARYGNTWAAYAAYHSRTPYYNVRYQLLIVNELIRMGVLAGPQLRVPPAKSKAATN